MSLKIVIYKNRMKQSNNVWVNPNRKLDTKMERIKFLPSRSNALLWFWWLDKSCPTQTRQFQFPWRRRCDCIFFLEQIESTVFVLMTVDWNLSTETELAELHTHSAHYCWSLDKFNLCRMENICRHGLLQGKTCRYRMFSQKSGNVSQYTFRR